MSMHERAFSTSAVKSLGVSSSIASESPGHVRGIRAAYFRKNFRHFCSHESNFFMSLSHFMQKCSSELIFNILPFTRMISLVQTKYFFVTADVVTTLAFLVSL